MSAATRVDVSPSTAGTSPTGASPAHPARRWALWVSLVLALMVLVTYLAGLAGSSDTPLDPENPGPNGMQALAQVLDDRGTEIEVVRGVASLPEESAEGATVMVSTTDFLSAESGGDLLRFARSADSLVVLSPADNLQDIFDIDVDVSSTSTPTAMSPECDSTLWDQSDRVTDGDTLLAVGDTIERGDASICLPPSPGYNAGGARSGYLVELNNAGADRSDNAAPTIVAGIADSLVNSNILNQANAATGLRLLGSTDRLIWVIPSISDAGELPPTGLFDVLPAPLAPSIALLVLALGVWALARGRRLGPVTTEPLPVIIRAIETTASRGRLYREAKDRPRALASLQLASHRRLTSRLGLAAGTTPDQVVTAVAQATGRHTDEINRLLVDTSVDNDNTLVQIARDLRLLEEGIPST